LELVKKELTSNTYRGKLLDPGINRKEKTERRWMAVIVKNSKELGKGSR
jgi:hypothetical protein